LEERAGVDVEKKGGNSRGGKEGEKVWGENGEKANFGHPVRIAERLHALSKNCQFDEVPLNKRGGRGGGGVNRGRACRKVLYPQKKI